MQITGSLLNIVFRNSENGYTVANLNVNGTLVTAVGIFPLMKEGEDLTLEGQYVENPKYGEQFKVSNVKISEPTNLDSILKFLASGLIKGIGEKTAELIVSVFGDKSLEVLENTPERLTEIRGIGAKKAQEIKESFKSTSIMRKTIIFLQEHNLSMGLIIKIYNEYKEDTQILVQENPYRLVTDLDGVGFITADKIAQSFGIAKCSEFRIEAGLTHLLSEAAIKSGHTYLPEEKLIASCEKLIDITETELIKKSVERLLYKNQLKFYLKSSENDEKIRCIALRGIYNKEKSISIKLLEMQHNAKPLNINLEKEIAQYEEQNNISLHPKQREAILSTMNEGTTIITGGPGTGKTTIINCILTILKNRELKVYLAAPTGRAAKRMSEACKEEAKTIHRLLGMEYMKGKLTFYHNEMEPLAADVIIIDELSMVDVFLFDALLKAITLGTRLILVGDKDQLPSVSCGRILGDLIASELFPIVYLNEIYRQSLDSMIILNAHKINKGEMPLINNKSRDFFFDEKDNQLDAANSIVSMVKDRIPNFLNVTPDRIQVLAPMKKGEAGVNNLNLKLQQALNPYGKEIHYKDVIFRVGDKVMQTTNNYDLEWETEGAYKENGKGVFNGDIGYIVSVNNNNLIVKMDDNKIINYPRAELDNLMLSYAISVHKSQGSEFDVVIIALGDHNFVIGNRNLIYTAVTRAKLMVVIVGSQKNLKKMIDNNYTAIRYTLLVELLKDNMEKINTHFKNTVFSMKNQSEKIQTQAIDNDKKEAIDNDRKKFKITIKGKKKCQE